MLWLKAFHIVFVVTWFAGLLYLPRLFVYYAMAKEDSTRTTLHNMQRKLLGITHIGGGLALLFCVWMLVVMPFWLTQSWMHAKLGMVVALIGYHIWCAMLVRSFNRGKMKHSHVWFRWFNEVPAILLIAIVILFVLKPF